MVATATVFSWNAGSDGAPVLAAVPAGPPNVRFKDADSNVVDTADPVVIEGAAKYSFWKHIALQFTGTYTQIDNIRHHTDGTIGWTLGTTGEARRGNRDTGDNGCAQADYDIADGLFDIGVAVNGHGFYNAQTTKTVDLATDTSGAPATIDSTAYTAPPDDTKAVVMQVLVDTDATAGDQADETFTWLYDEI